MTATSPHVVTVMDPGWLSNAYLVYDRRGGHGIIVDTGAPHAPILEAARAHSLRVDLILNTHFHGDHIAANAPLAKALGARIGAHALEVGRIPSASLVLEHGQRIERGDLVVEVLHIPGHTKGQAAFLVNGCEVFTGDTLFRRSIGGCVGPGASGFEDLRRSLVERLLTLSDEVRVRPGHTEPTTIGEERRENPFLRVMQGIDPPGRTRARAMGREVTLIVHARDYDGGTKAWVRFEDDGTEATVPGSRVEVA